MNPVNPDDNELSNNLQEPQSIMPSSTGASGTYPAADRSDTHSTTSLDMENDRT
jgi:hypothetical protein